MAKGERTWMARLTNWERLEVETLIAERDRLTREIERWRNRASKRRGAVEWDIRGRGANAD